MAGCFFDRIPDLVSHAGSWLGHFIFNFQTLITGLMALGAAYYAGSPVWRQLKDSNLQTRILHRETLASLLREGMERFARIEKEIWPLLSEADRITSDPIGEPVEIDDQTAFYLAQKLRGEGDWYFTILRSTETEEIERTKAEFSAAYIDLIGTLDDVHWPAHNDQHGEDYSLSDDQWREIMRKSDEGQILASMKVTETRKAFRELQSAQAEWVKLYRAKIAQLDQDIAAA